MTKETLIDIWSREAKALWEGPLWKGSPLLSKAQEALRLFKEWGLPNKKWEDWKYTNPLPYLEEISSLEAPEDTVSADFLKDLELDGHLLVTVNGRLNEALSSLAEGIKLQKFTPATLPATLAERLALSEKPDPFEALNLATLEEIVSLKVEKNTISEKPVYLVHVLSGKSSGQVIRPRLMIESEAHSETTLVELYVSAGEAERADHGPVFMNPVTDVLVRTGGRLEYVKAQIQGTNSTHIGKLKSTVERDGHLNSFTFSVGGALTRNNLSVALKGEGAFAGVHGLFALKEKQHCDNYSLIDHCAPHTDSEQVFKGVLDGLSHGVFTGHVVIHRDAQKVNAQQLNKNLLLNKLAHVDTRPQLEVYADDVKCGHGATVGQISEEESFYLQSRGLNEARAREILCHAFAVEALLTIKNENARAWLMDRPYKAYEHAALELEAKDS